MPNAPAIGWRNGFRSPARKVIDWTNPMTARLMAYHVPTGGSIVKDLCGRFDLDVFGSNIAAKGTTTWGSGMASSTTPAQGAARKTGLNGPLSLQPPVTLMWVGRFDGEPDAGQIFYGVDYIGFGGTDFTNAIYKAGFPGWLKYNTFSGGTNRGAEVFGISPDYTVPIPRVLIATVSASGMALWMNGVQVATNGTAITTLDYSDGFAATDGSFFCVHCRQGASGGTVNATFNAGAVWNRALTDAEIIRLSADPFLFLKA
jgi:hypothetical protein